MRTKALLPTSLLVLALTGCGSTEMMAPPTQTVTADVKGDSTVIYWLDERQKFPETLTTLSLMGDYGSYGTEYRFRKGIVREIQREGTVFTGDSVKPISLLIRYDSEGQAVYQQYRVDGDLLPVRPTELVRYFREAEQSLAMARELHSNDRNFFQGYWNEGSFEECNTGRELTLKFETVLPSYIVQRLSQEDNFLAAAGKVGRNVNVVEEVIALDSDSAECFVRPSFEQ